MEITNTSVTSPSEPQTRASSSFWTLDQPTSGSQPPTASKYCICSAFHKFLFYSASCNGKHKFDTTKSSTFVSNGKAWTITYGSGNAKGILEQDTVRVSQ